MSICSTNHIIPFQIEKLPLILSVGRSERSDLRHANPNEIKCVGGRYARSDPRKNVYYIEEMVLPYQQIPSLSIQDINSINLCTINGKIIPEVHPQVSIYGGNKMAKKRKSKKTRTPLEECTLQMQTHIHRIGLSSVEDYKNWCRRHNFSRGLEKNSRQLQKELSFASAMIASEIMANEKKIRNLKTVIPKIYSGELNSEKVKHSTAREIEQAFQRSNSKKTLLQLLLYIEENSDILEEAVYVKGIEAIANCFEKWIRPLQTWRSKSHNRTRQFSELLRHLFVSYDIPSFMDNVWLAENETHHNWYIHIGAGQNIRTAPDIPVVLTKKMAHHFLNAPKKYNIDEAIRWGQVHALGGDKRLMDALRGTQLIEDYPHDDFWLSVIRFFIANPMLDVNHVHPIIDYIWNQKFQNQQVFVGRGVIEEMDPPQPNFSMKGRTPDTLLRQVNDWHQELGRETRGGDLQWSRSDISEFYHREGSEEKRNLKNWHIRELLSTKELVTEGKEMKHCVRSYARSCYAGQTSIWTLESEEDENGRNKVLTIEISHPQNLIRQVRGKRNRVPTLQEKYLLELWTAKENLRIAEYVQFERG